MTSAQSEARRRVFESIERLGLVHCVPEAPQLGLLVSQVSMEPAAFVELVAALETQAADVEPLVLDAFRGLREDVRQIDASGVDRCHRVQFATPMWVLMRVVGAALRCDTLSNELCSLIGQTLADSGEALSAKAPSTAERLVSVGAGLVEWADQAEATAAAIQRDGRPSV